MWCDCLDLLSDVFAEGYMLASGVYSVGWILSGRLISAVTWGFADAWFPLSQSICLGGMLGSVTATALEG
jgi:hypothetical protein